MKYPFRPHTLAAALSLALLAMASAQAQSNDTSAPERRPAQSAVANRLR